MNEPVFLTIKVPEKSDWQARMLGNVIFRPDRGGEPNRFHRFMQWLCFGIVWERV
jgi:hypothetical protein